MERIYIFMVIYLQNNNKNKNPNTIIIMDIYKIIQHDYEYPALSNPCLYTSCHRLASVGAYFNNNIIYYYYDDTPHVTSVSPELYYTILCDQISITFSE